MGVGERTEGGRREDAGTKGGRREGGKEAGRREGGRTHSGRSVIGLVGELTFIC